jgi:hypothetical protein
VISHDDNVFKEHFDPEKQIAEITKELPEITEETLEQGFIFKVTLLDLPRKIDDVVRIKRSAFISKCPETAEISSVYGLKIDDIDSAAFNVSNCGPSYKVYYVPRFGIFYEIQQIYAGDLGFKQKFEAVSGDIIPTIDFYLSEEEIFIEQPYITKIIDAYKFTFRYSSDLTEGCCATDVPLPNRFFSPIMNMGKASSTDVKTNDKIAFFGSSTRYQQQPESFDAEFQKHQDLLINDYKLVTGENPDTKMTELDIGGRTGYKLEGYSWQGYDLVYFTINGKNVIIMVIDSGSGEEFEKYADEIVESIELF